MKYKNGASIKQKNVMGMAENIRGYIMSEIS